MRCVRRAVICLLFSIAGSAVAQEAPTTEQLLEALKGKVARGVQDHAANSESAQSNELAKLISALKEKESRGLPVSAADRKELAEAVKEQPQIDIDINFDFNSNDITDRVRPVLMALGRALVKLDANSTFVVAGHTDAKGKPAYNQALSERRAQAVKDFLGSQFSLKKEQLIVVGYGSEQLKNRGKPYADENRRVQVVNATPDVTAAK
jgi:outer membrane protein OmpA-like peptidoglycan-associated protein